jgi:HPt (histidine-containing phosphotransfer) domain-containing protein
MMSTMEKQLDRDFLLSYYKEMVNEIGEIFQLFIEEMPTDLHNVKTAFANKNYKEAADSLHKIAPSFYNIGLPQLTKKVQATEALLHNNKFDEAQTLLNEFEIDLDSYMPAIIDENERLASLDNF